MNIALHRPHPTRAVRRIRRLRRWAVAVGVVSICSLPAFDAGARTSPRSARACSVTPAADGLPLGAYLVGMYRMRNDKMEVLHKVECTDHSVGYVWISSDII